MKIVRPKLLNAVIKVHPSKNIDDPLGFYEQDNNKLSESENVLCCDALLIR